MSDETKEIKIPQSLEHVYAEMKFQMDMARQLVASRALKFKTAEEAFVVMQAGKEMGLQPMESLQKLYIVNGNVSFWGTGLLSELTKIGIEFSYTEESEKGVTVTAEYNKKIYPYKVHRNDPVFNNSNAIKFAPQNKMRHHGIKMIAEFYFPHLIGAGVWEKDDYIDVGYKEMSSEKAPMLTPSGNELEAQEAQKEVDQWIMEMDNCETLEALEAYYAANKKALTKNIGYLSHYGRLKKAFETQKNEDQ